LSQFIARYMPQVLLLRCVYNKLLSRSQVVTANGRSDPSQTSTPSPERRRFTLPHAYKRKYVALISSCTTKASFYSQGMKHWRQNVGRNQETFVFPCDLLKLYALYGKWLQILLQEVICFPLTAALILFSRYINIMRGCSNCTRYKSTKVASINKTKQTQWLFVRKRTIATERPPPVGEF
jgi:hypothetical protein